MLLLSIIIIYSFYCDLHVINTVLFSPLLSLLLIIIVIVATISFFYQLLSGLKICMDYLQLNYP